MLGENVSQTASFVAAGSADAGIVALSLALAPSMREKGKYVEIPPWMSTPRWSRRQLF